MIDAISQAIVPRDAFVKYPLAPSRNARASSSIAESTNCEIYDGLAPGCACAFPVLSRSGLLGAGSNDHHGRFRFVTNVITGAPNRNANARRVTAGAIGVTASRSRHGACPKVGTVGGLERSLADSRGVLVTWRLLPTPPIAYRSDMDRLLPIVMLAGANVFMTYAWYGHLKDARDKPLLFVILTSWAVAFVEYCLQVPANRIGHRTFTLAQLKVIQEVITMCVFAVFATVYMRERVTADYAWAGLCLVGAAYFMFRKAGVPA